METPARSRIRRGAQTPRGRETRAAILNAARRACSEQWLDQLSLAELARAAGTTRASVLFQFPEGWLDIAAELHIEELEAARNAVDKLVRARFKPEQRLRLSLHYFLARGEELGALLPNVRAFSYFWGDGVDAQVTPVREAILERVGLLLRAAAPARPPAAEERSAAETLVFFAFDLVAAPMFRRLRPEERGARLDTAITLMLKGLSGKQRGDRRSSTRRDHVLHPIAKPTGDQ
jgi:AcrR family transcriptional regulator